jgi:Carboxypeptidase regulatory-like domain
MKSFILALALLMQAGPQSVGVVTGVVRGANGMLSPGVRVYAIGVRDTLEALNTGTAPLEGLTQTDASGRYRLEVTPGRYYIASGSVNSPTFYPGTANAADARVVTVASGGLVESIDFSSFVPASRSAIGVPMGTGVLSGTLRFPDGTPAPAVPVNAVSAALMSGAPSTTPLPALVGNAYLQLVQPNPAPGTPPIPPPPPTVIYLSQRISSGGGARILSRTDATGRFTISGVPADTYYIAAGYSEFSAIYPGVTDLAAAKTITTTPTTNLSTLDFTVPRPSSATVVVSGRITTPENAPTPGMRVEIASSSPPAPSVFGLPTITPNRFVDVGADGRFQFANVRQGSYAVRASYSTIYSDSKSIVVADQPLDSVDFVVRLPVLFGRILGEDGSEIPNVQRFAEAIVSTVDNPNASALAILQIATDGSFSRILRPGNYRFYIRTLPVEYSIKSITAGGVDLTKENLKFGNESMSVDVRVAKLEPSPDPSAASVRGRMLDALSGVPSTAERVTFCCRASGPVEQFSALLKADGSFEFAAIPPGRYAVGLQTKSGGPNLYPVVPVVDVGQKSVSDLELLSAPEFGELSAKFLLENGTPPENFSASVVFTGANGRVRVVVSPGRGDGMYRSLLPAGERYAVSVIDLPAGYVMKSMIGSTEVPMNNPQSGVPAPSPVVITLARESR